MMTTHYTPEFVESFPTPLDAWGLLHLPRVQHLRPPVRLRLWQRGRHPTLPAQWSFTYDGDSISVRPSVGNWSFACKSHYVINKGHVRWARGFFSDEIARNRARDRAALDGPNSNSGEPRDESRADRPRPGQSAGNARRGTLHRLFGWVGRRV